jgi:hypothetical protein
MSLIIEIELGIFVVAFFFLFYMVDRNFMIMINKNIELINRQNAILLALVRKMKGK